MGPENQVWIAIEGTDGTGKTTLAKSLAQWLMAEHPGKNPYLMPEFSGTPVGDLIREIIKDRTFFRLGKTPLPIAETLILTSDLAAQREGLREHELIVSDRGIFSLIVYQGIRLAAAYENRRDWLKWINSLTEPLGRPNLTICLHAPLDQIEARLRRRGDGVTEEGLDFIRKAQQEFIKLAGAVGQETFVLLENREGCFADTEEAARCMINGLLIPLNC